MTWAAELHHHARRPWEIYVNARGERFVDEDEPSVHVRERALLKQPGVKFWIVFDEEILRAAPAIIRGQTPAKVRALFATHPMFAQAQSLELLATKAGIEPAGLVQSVRRYNEALAQGAPDPFGRTFRPRALASPPFRAVLMHGGATSGAVGVAVDESLRVIDRDRRPIPGLYAAGEVLGTGALMGEAFVGGMNVTPAMTFGRLLGEKILSW
jgi:fumarate reductase flavoprotein subunit